MDGARDEKSRLPINPRVLRWARKRAGRTLEEAAKRVNVKNIAQVEAWEDVTNTKTPTVRQARILADFYARSFLELFRSEPPKLADPKLVPDFRLYRSAADPPQTRERRDIQLWAEAQRENALDLYHEIGDEPAEFPKALFTTVAADPESLAAEARRTMNFPVEDQIALNASERYQIPNILRRKIEGLGVLTLRSSDLKYLGARGFCIAVFPLPVIVIGSEAPAAQAFTLGHEFAHVLLKQSALSGSISREGGGQLERRVEEWCNRFSAAFLMPKTEITKLVDRPKVAAARFSEEDLNRIAKHFKVSEHAALIRLVNLGYVRANYYWNIKKPDFDAEAVNYKGFGRAKYYGSRYRGAVGDLYTSLVMEAWSSGRITNHNAAEYMGIKNLAHLKDIRDNF